MLAPFVLIMAAFVWDLRAYVAHRTDLAREVYVFSELIAAEVDANPLVRSGNPAALRLVDAFIDRFEGRGAGSLDIAVVRRDDTRRDGTPCEADSPWCPPLVATRWPDPADPSNAERFWADVGGGAAGGECTLDRNRSDLPHAGDPFGPNQPMLRNEPATGATEADWISRDMDMREWWVIVDVCLHPGPGTFTGPLIQAGMEALDFGSFTAHHRGAWRSIHDRGSCDWCGF